MNLYEYTDKALAEMLGEAVKRDRLDIGIKRDDLIYQADITDYQLRKVETGEAFLPIIRVMRALGTLDQLGVLLEREEVIDPRAAYEEKPPRQRVRS